MSSSLLMLESCASSRWRFGICTFGAGADDKSFRHLANFDPGEGSALLYVENGNIVAVRVADTAIFAIGRKHNPVRAIPRGELAAELFGFQVINVDAVIQQAGDPQLLTIRSQCETMSQRVRRFELARARRSGAP